MFQRLWDLGFDAINWLWRYFLLGAVIVMPIWLVSRLSAARTLESLDAASTVCWSSPASRVTTAQVFAIAGPAMVANLTTPLIGIVSTIAIGRLGDATSLGGVAMASVLFDCLFWLFAFLRMSTVAFTAQSLGAGEMHELRAILVRGLIVAALVGAGLIALQIPLAAILLGAMGGSEGVTRAARTYFAIRIWSAPLALANYVVLGWLIGQARATLALGVQIAINLINMAATLLLVLTLDLGIAGAAMAALIAEALGLLIGVAIAHASRAGSFAAVAGHPVRPRHARCECWPSTATS